jgi:ABC-type multidrug transport system ATPase subunit
LVKRFGDAEAVKGISFDITQGESFGFLGPNGAGKTSTMRMISARSQPTSGTLSVLGMDPRTQGPAIRTGDLSMPLDLKPGDEFEIKLGRKQIRLAPLGAEDEE